MQRVIVILFTFLFACCLATSSNAAGKKPPAKLRTDSTAIIVKKFDQAALNQYKTDKEFNYDGQEAAPDQQSLWDRFWNWIWEVIGKGIRAVPFGGQIIEYAIKIGLVILLIYAILKAAGIDFAGVLRRNSAKVNVPYSESLENIHQIDFDSEIEKAVSQHNFRLAVRMLYLKCLKELSDANLIHWQIDKTNEAYQYELADLGQKQTFGLLTRQFEYVWYGNFTIDRQAYTNIDLLFKNFKKQLP